MRDSASKEERKKKSRNNARDAVVRATVAVFLSRNNCGTIPFFFLVKASGRASLTFRYSRPERSRVIAFNFGRRFSRLSRAFSSGEAKLARCFSRALFLAVAGAAQVFIERREKRRKIFPLVATFCFLIPIRLNRIE